MKKKSQKALFSLLLVGVLLALSCNFITGGAENLIEEPSPTSLPTDTPLPLPTETTPPTLEPSATFTLPPPPTDTPVPEPTATRLPPTATRVQPTPTPRIAHVVVTNNLSVNLTAKLRGPEIRTFILYANSSMDFEIQPGEYTFSLSAPGYQTLTGTQTFKPGENTWTIGKAK